MRPRGLIKDMLILFIGYHIIKLWITGESITYGIGLGMMALMFFSVMFIVERFK
jgi:hypothetical protein